MAFRPKTYSKTDIDALPPQVAENIKLNADGSEFDELERPYGNPQDIRRAPDSVGPTRGQILEQLGQDENSLTHVDSKAFERESTAPCISTAIPMTDEMESKVAAAAMIQTALENPNAMNQARVSGASRAELAQRLAEVRKEMPTPDAVTFVDNRRVIIPSEVRDVPNQLAKQKSMKLLEMIVGKELNLRVIKSARAAGVCFFQKPCLWLAQRLAQELSKRMIWEKIVVADDYVETDDGNNDSEICKAVATLFSYHVLEQMQVICATRRISMVHCAKLLIARVCDLAEEEKAPKDLKDEYDDIGSLEAAIANVRTA